MVGADAHHRTQRDRRDRSRFGVHRAERSRRPRAGMRAARVHGHRERARRGRPQPALRRPAPPRDRPRAGHEAEAALLDEPAAGINPAEKRELMDLIRAIRDRGLHGAAHRARHEPRHGRLRPHQSCSTSADRSPRDARRGARQTPRSSRPTWECRPMLLEVEDLHVYYGAHRGPEGHLVHGRRGRDRHADRRQRGRQDDHAEGDLRRTAAVRRAGSCSTDGHHPHCRRTIGSASASARPPRDAGSSPA